MAEEKKNEFKSPFSSLPSYSSIVKSDSTNLNFSDSMTEGFGFTSTSSQITSPFFQKTNAIPSSFESSNKTNVFGSNLSDSSISSVPSQSFASSNQNVFTSQSSSFVGGSSASLFGQHSSSKL